MTTAQTAFPFDNSLARDLPGFSLSWQAAKVSAPRLIKLNHALARELGLDPEALEGDAGAQMFSGNLPPDGAQPVALVYAGHQFGGFSPQLGDGRALLLGEVIDVFGQRRDIALKGSGRTPFSRNGDGKAALGPVLREYLVSEAMQALGIPTTRALAAVTTGELVYRETALPGAVLTRVASSHLRVGTFQFFAARGEHDKVRQLVDYAITRHYPDVLAAENKYLAFLKGVCARQAALVAKWMLAGFIHGVMNTDNMTLSGETIDYGPCAFMEHYDPVQVFSSIDSNGRYAYANQPRILAWNLVRLAECLLPLLHEDRALAVDMANAVIGKVDGLYQAAWLSGMRGKLGLATCENGDNALAQGLLDAMETGRADYTLAFRHLARAAEGDEAPLRALFTDDSALDLWLAQWQARLAREAAAPAQRAIAMRAKSPAFIPRNHRVEEAIEAAVEGDFAPFETLLHVLARPFDDQPEHAALMQPASVAQTADYRTFCGT